MKTKVSRRSLLKAFAAVAGASVIPSWPLPQQRGVPLIVDLFAGGGGASCGIEAATGRRVDIAINHNPVALAVHAANHPDTIHMETDVFDVSPRAVCGSRPVDLLWASPDCTHFSIAKGDVPRSKDIRDLAWVVIEWARQVRPRIIFLENVREFQGWGPLGANGKPLKSRQGETFREWLRQLRAQGYAVEFRILDASEFGAPTKRKRLFMVARCDGQPIVWPEKTHGPGLVPFRTAAECIDWSLPCPSIFERERPLAKNTLRRIAQGIQRFVIDTAEPYIISIDQQGSERADYPVDAPLTTIVTKQRHAVVAPYTIKVNHSGDGDRSESLEAPLSTVTAARRGHGLVVPTLISTGHGERDGQAPRVPGLHKPLGTVVATANNHGLVAAFLAKHNLGVIGHGVERPIGTITAKDHHSLVVGALAKMRGNPKTHFGAADLKEPLGTVSAQGNHFAEVRAFLTAFYGDDGPKGQSLNSPLRTVTTKDRLGLVTVHGVDYAIVDIGMRMLQPHELKAAQFGRFAATYDLSAATTKEDQTFLIGNSVCPELAERVVAANFNPNAERRAA